MNHFFSAFLILMIYSAFSFAQPPICIWSGTKEKAKVELTPYLPSSAEARIAIIVCPGGSYWWLDHKTEGKLAAEWLRDSGIAAFVLKYRTAGIGAFITSFRTVFTGHQHPDMIQDIQRAIQLIREDAEKYHVDPEKIGVMGFSAGGHLAMSSGIYFDTNFLGLLGIMPGVSLRPDFVAPIYPVVTLSDERYVHKRSRRGLLGEFRKANRKMQDSLSLEKHIPADCPPVFLLNCVDDPIVKFQNSILLDSALTTLRIPHKYIQYQTGGHGFGGDERKGSEESREWKREFLDWLNTLFK